MSAGRPLQRVTVWYFVNIYSGTAQWHIPPHPAPEAPDDIPDSFLVGEVLQNGITPDNRSGQYSALSYCAGSATKTAKIMINGYWFNLFANCEHAMESIRQSYEDSELQAPSQSIELLIWTDQICINQSNNTEKSQQVAFMRDIYQRAGIVHISLSTASATPDLYTTARQGMIALNIIGEAALGTSRSWLRTNEREMDRVERRLVRQIRRYLLDSPAGRQIVRNCFNFLATVVQALYWTRAWVRNIRFGNVFSSKFFRSFKSSWSLCTHISIMVVIDYPGPNWHPSSSSFVQLLRIVSQHGNLTKHALGPQGFSLQTYLLWFHGEEARVT
jgi:Heterokaryon incompatibility protein (HET)